MSRTIDLPDEANRWMTGEIRDLLRAICGQHVRKKRATVIKLAFARANEQPLAEVFRQPDVCSESIWYQKWRHVPEISAAYDACYQRALAWADEQTAEIEAHYRRQRRQSIAVHAAEAPGELAAVMSDAEQAGGNRISAAESLLRWAEPETAGQMRGSLAVEVVNPGELTDEERARALREVLGQLQSEADRRPADDGSQSA